MRRQDFFKRPAILPPPNMLVKYLCWAYVAAVSSAPLARIVIWAVAAEYSLCTGTIRALALRISPVLA